MPVSVRLTATEQRRFAREARRRGLTLSEFLRQSARNEATRTDWNAFFAANPPVTLPAGARTDLSTREGFED